jgi:aminoglycoside/choline kinase family phosphotransferase
LERARSWLEQRHGGALRELVPLPGGAGARRYWRARFADGATAVLMHALPEDPAILPPALRVQGEQIPFVAVTAFLAGHGLPVPRIFAVDARERLVLLEDLGDMHLLDLPRPERDARLDEAIDLLARVHAIPRADALPFQRCFDETWVRFELRTFAEHGLDPRWHASLAPELDALARAIAELPRVLCLRDYQSQNLMIDAAGRLRLLDYQDALHAPAELDLAALLFDSYLEQSDGERARRLARYWSARGATPDPAAFSLLVVQRKCKDYGRFRFVTQVKHDTRYAPFVARAKSAVLGALPGLPARQRRLAEILSEALGPVDA